MIPNMTDEESELVRARALGKKVWRWRTSRLIPSKRAAAELAGFDEQTWRKLESGEYRERGGKRVDPAVMFKAAGQEYNPLPDLADEESVDNLEAVRREAPEFYAALDTLAGLHRRERSPTPVAATSAAENAVHEAERTVTALKARRARKGSSTR